MSRWVDACGVDEVEPDDVIGVELDGHDYAIYRSPDGEFFATEGHCTHEQVLLCDGLVMDGVIECPKHNGRFDYTSGAALGVPVTVDLQTYPTEVVDGTVRIDVDPAGA
ncbi:MAG: Rieske 2Fe-2S domain-containing protein [Actinomycetota bacterium]